MAHDPHAPDARLVPVVLLLFFIMSAVGHYVFVMRDGYAAHGAAAGEHPEAAPAAKPGKTLKPGHPE